MKELIVWKEWIKKDSPKKILKELLPQAMITTDAAPEGWGATLHFITPSSYKISSKILHHQLPLPNISNPSSITFGSWGRVSKGQSSNWKELSAIYLALSKFAPIIKERKLNSILILSDNSTACYNINRRAASMNLVPMLKKVINLAESLHLQIKTKHIPEILNTETDALSRLERSGDYYIKYPLLQKSLHSLHLKPFIDLFASAQNHRLPIYGSLRNCRKPSLRQVNVGDAFLLNWYKMSALIHPPIPLIGRVLLKYINEAGGPSALIVLDWPGQT
jgi:hypothetical protein